MPIFYDFILLLAIIISYLITENNDVKNDNATRVYSRFKRVTMIHVFTSGLKEWQCYRFLLPV